MGEGKVNFELGISTWLNKNQGEIITIHVEFLEVTTIHYDHNKPPMTVPHINKVQ